MPAIDLQWMLGNFSCCMFAVALFFILLHKMIVRGKLDNDEIIYRWMALFPLGLTAIYTFVIHAFYPHLADVTIGWAPSPFEYEVAIADLALGVVAILSFNASYGFRLAAVLVNAIFLFGCAANHIYLMIAQNNFSAGNAGSWLWLNDLLVPIIMLLCIHSLSKKPSRKKC